MQNVLTVTLNPCLDKTLNIADFKKGEVNRAESTFLDAGGKGINVSRALSNFEVSNVAMGIVGGANGKILTKKLSEEGVECDFLEVDGETRVNYKIFDQKSGETTDINEPGIQITDDIMNKFLEKYRENLRWADFAVLAGSIPPGMPDNIYRILVEEAVSAEVKVILDTSGIRLSEGIKAKPYAIKPNLDEFEELLGRPLRTDTQILSGIKEIINTGIDTVVVSMGKSGAIFMQGDVAYKTGTLGAEVKSTVGCGDSVVAGMIYSMVSGFDLKKTAMIASAAGGVTATKDGTTMCRKSEVLDAYANIRTDRIQFL